MRLVRPVLGLLMLALIGACGEPKPSLSELMQRVHARPAPDLATLATRSTQPDGMGAFLDLLKVREDGGVEAVPTLIEILDAHRCKTRIHGFAAAQALFRIGGDKTREALRRNLLADGYPWYMALTYAHPPKQQVNPTSRPGG